MTSSSQQNCFNRSAESGDDLFAPQLRVKEAGPAVKKTAHCAELYVTTNQTSSGSDGNNFLWTLFSLEVQSSLSSFNDEIQENDGITMLLLVSMQSAQLAVKIPATRVPMTRSCRRM